MAPFIYKDRNATSWHIAMFLRLEGLVGYSLSTFWGLDLLGMF